MGIAGAGRAFERLYGPALAQIPEFHVVAVADPRPVELPGVRRWPSVEAMLAAEPLDGLLVLSPPAAHAAQVEAGLTAGLAVLTEKPAALTAGEVDGWPDSGQFAAAYTRRGWGCYRRARGAPARAWTFVLETDPAGWGAFDRPRLAHDLLPHAIDLAEWLTGSEIRDVRDVRGDQRALEGVFELADGRTFAWRVAYGQTYREELRGDGRVLVRRPRRLPVLGRFRRREDTDGAARVLRAWAAQLRGRAEGADLLAGRAAVRRHAAVLEAVDRITGGGAG
ncbi:MAG: Gfo/Idh/MocA family oxidoreductase [Dehalococcoidia bacterium]|nr:Gfo/Idh/MocA family oxidoreductase [Dehalococcoidia bacterium]